MDIYTSIKEFYDFVESNPLTPGQIALWHALLHTNNKARWSEWFTVASHVLINRTGLTRASIIRARNTLKQYGLIDFKPDGRNATAYTLYQNDSDCDTATGQNAIQQPDKKRTESEREPDTNRTPESDSFIESRARKTNTKTNTKTKTNTGGDTRKRPPERHKHGEYNNVLLTDSELETLKTEFPDWEERIERLSGYIASTGKAYKSHLATIRNWARKDAEVPKRKKVSFQAYDQGDSKQHYPGPDLLKEAREEIDGLD